MAKDRKLANQTKEIKIVKKLSNGMFVGKDGEMIPPFSGVEIGSSVKIEKGRFLPTNQSVVQMPNQATQNLETMKKQLEEQNHKIEELLKVVGDKAGEVKINFGANDE
jgi:hypothetical protein